MNLLTIKQYRWAAPLVTLAFLLFATMGPIQTAFAADLTTTPAPTGTSVLTQNGGTVVTTFTPALGPTLTSSTTASTTAYYGVRSVSATTSPDVFWRITISHATSTLLAGQVGITEKGFFNASSSVVADSTYTPTVSLGNIVLTGASGRSIVNGDDFTNVDGITFSTLAPTGTYTVTRVLMNTASSTAIGDPYSFIVSLLAPAAPVGPDTTPPAAPTVTTILGCAASSSPITFGGMAEASSTISVLGGLSTSTATSTTSAGGVWSGMFSLTPNATNTFMITATDQAGNVSATTTKIIIHDSIAPVITPNGSSTMTVTQGNPFTDPGVTVTDNLSTSTTATTTGSVNTSVPGTYTLTYTATDCAGNTASTTRTVQVVSQSTGGSSSNTSGSSNPPSSVITSNSGTTTSGGSSSGSTNSDSGSFTTSNFTPGFPSTGAGGDDRMNWAIMLGSLSLVILGYSLLKTKRSQQL